MAFAQSIKRALFRIAQPGPEQTVAQEQMQPSSAVDQPTAAANVIQLRSGLSNEDALHTASPESLPSAPDSDGAGADTNLEQAVAEMPKSIRFPGYLDCPEIKGFLAQGFFGFGRHNGARYPSQQALNSGKAALIANFCNALDSVIEKSHAKQDSLELHRVDVATVCPDVATRIDVALRQIQRGIDLLQQQKTDALQEHGWIAGPLRDYEAGFTRGARDAVDFSRFEI